MRGELPSVEVRGGAREVPTPLVEVVRPVASTRVAPRTRRCRRNRDGTRPDALRALHAVTIEEHRSGGRRSRRVRPDRSHALGSVRGRSLRRVRGGGSAAQGPLGPRRGRLPGWRAAGVAPRGASHRVGRPPPRADGRAGRRGPLTRRVGRRTRVGRCPRAALSNEVEERGRSRAHRIRSRGAGTRNHDGRARRSRGPLARFLAERGPCRRVCRTPHRAPSEFRVEARALRSRQIEAHRVVAQIRAHRAERGDQDDPGSAAPSVEGAEFVDSRVSW